MRSSSDKNAHRLTKMYPRVKYCNSAVTWVRWVIGLLGFIGLLGLLGFTWVFRVELNELNKPNEASYPHLLY